MVSLDSSKKQTNKSFFCGTVLKTNLFLFLEESEDTIKSFRNYLTFSYFFLTGNTQVISNQVNSAFILSVFWVFYNSFDQFSLLTLQILQQRFSRKFIIIHYLKTYFLIYFPFWNNYHIYSKHLLILNTKFLVFFSFSVFEQNPIVWTTVQATWCLCRLLKLLLILTYLDI